MNENGRKFINFAEIGGFINFVEIGGIYTFCGKRSEEYATCVIGLGGMDAVAAPHQGVPLGVKSRINKIIYQDILTAHADAANDLSMPCHEQQTKMFN